MADLLFDEVVGTLCSEIDTSSSSTLGPTVARVSKCLATWALRKIAYSSQDEVCYDFFTYTDENGPLALIELVFFC